MSSKWTELNNDGGNRIPPASQPLFDPGPVDTATLTAPQRQVYDAVGRDGITAQEAGRLLYPDSPIAHSYGRAVLQRLKALGLVVERRNPHRYELAKPSVVPSDDIPY